MLDRAAVQYLPRAHRHAKSWRQHARLPGDGQAARIYRIGKVLHPAVITGVDRRLELAVGDVRGQPQVGEDDLLEHLALAVAQLRLERHGRGFVDPDAITISQLVHRYHRDHAGIATRDARLLQFGDLVEAGRGGVDARQAGEQQTGVVTLL